VERPSRIDDLVPPPPWAEPHPFKVTVTIELSGLTYENFTTDLKADRPFLYEHMNDATFQMKYGTAYLYGRKAAPTASGKGQAEETILHGQRIA
jgi:hypothetical protein